MPQRSAFIDIVGWVFVVLAGFGVMAGILQNLMLHLFFPDDWQEQLAEGAVQVGAAFEIFRYLDLIFGLVLVIMIVTLAAAIGLLKRKNWARLTFIGLLCAGVLWNVANFAWQVFFFESFLPPMAEIPQDFEQQFLVMQSAMVWVTAIFALAVSCLFGWIAWKLTRPAIRAEFLPAH